MYNRVIQGDCTTVLKTLPGESVDFVLTDPPYFVRYRDRDSRDLYANIEGPKKTTLQFSARPNASFVQGPSSSVSRR